MEYAATGAGLETLQPPDAEGETHEPAASEEPAKPRKKIGKKRSRSEDAAVASPPAEPEPKPKPAPAGTLALPPPPAVKLAKTSSAFSYDDNVEDAQDPRAFEKATSQPKNLPPEDVMSPPRPASLFGKFSAAARGDISKKAKAKRRRMQKNNDDSEDDLLSPASLKSNLEKYLSENKEPWFANR